MSNQVPPYPSTFLPFLHQSKAKGDHSPSMSSFTAWESIPSAVASTSVDGPGAWVGGCLREPFWIKGMTSSLGASEGFTLMWTQRNEVRRVVWSVGAEPHPFIQRKHKSQTHPHPIPQTIPSVLSGSPVMSLMVPYLNFLLHPQLLIVPLRNQSSVHGFHNDPQITTFSPDSLSSSRLHTNIPMVDSLREVSPFLRLSPLRIKLMMAFPNLNLPLHPISHIGEAPPLQLRH